MSINVHELNDVFAKFSKLSYSKYAGYSHVAGFYEAMLSGLLLEYDTSEQVFERIKAMINELEVENNSLTSSIKSV